MVAQVKNFPNQSNVLDEVLTIEQSVLPQQQLVSNDSDVFGWRKVESLRFVVQVAFSVLIVGFCIGKLSGLGETQNGDKAIYWGGLTSIVAWWMPTPGAKSSNQAQK